MNQLIREKPKGAKGARKVYDRPLCFICKKPHITNSLGKYGEGGFNTCSPFCLNVAKQVSRMTR